MIWLAHPSYHEANQAHSMISTTEPARGNWCASGEREETTRGAMSPQSRRGDVSRGAVLIRVSCCQIATYRLWTRIRT
jgi:hypothetical protein